MAERLYEGNTARLTLADLKHDQHGDLKGNATVTYAVYRANGDTHDSGSMVWNGTARQWQATFTAPSLDDTATERLRVVIRPVAQGATRDFPLVVPVYEIAAH